MVRKGQTAVTEESRSVEQRKGSAQGHEERKVYEGRSLPEKSPSENEKRRDV